MPASVVGWLCWAVLIIVSPQNIGGTCEKPAKVQLTVMAEKTHASQTIGIGSVGYKCYLGSGDSDAEITTARPFKTRPTILPDHSPQPELGGFLSDLPENTAARKVILQMWAFGAYSIEATKAGKLNTTTMLILMNSYSGFSKGLGSLQFTPKDVSSTWSEVEYGNIYDYLINTPGYAIPSDKLFTETVNSGEENVTIDMHKTRDVDDFNWKINGGEPVKSHVNPNIQYQSDDFHLIGGRPVTVEDTGLYECFVPGTRDDGHQGLKRLIVRACPGGKWGPPGCTGICDYCYNGGVCDDETGRCICPPGFLGPNCLTACGRNRFGYSCEFTCSNVDQDDSCRRLQFCLVDPFGCRCNTGFQGLDCDTECSSSKFGAGCLQDCHCVSNGACSRFTGVCDSRTCESGWSGTNCQIPDVCPDGYYGPSCTEKCRCMADVPCDKTTGQCPNNDCGHDSVLDLVTLKCNPEPPVFVNCPTPITLFVVPGQTSALIAWHPVQLENQEDCILFSSAESGSQFNLGSKTVAIQATDFEGNIAWCNFTVTVTDATVPGKNATKTPSNKPSVQLLAIALPATGGLLVLNALCIGVVCWWAHRRGRGASSNDTQKEQATPHCNAAFSTVEGKESYYEDIKENPKPDQRNASSTDQNDAELNELGYLAVDIC